MSYKNKEWIKLCYLLFAMVKQFRKYALYYSGTWEEKLFEKCVAVVGSRRMTDYGRRVVEKIVPQLVSDGWTIVSGLMYGIDQAAHETCLECGGHTIAVLGWGINYFAGEREQFLQNRISQNGGLVVSLWEDQMGTNWTFPARNKVVAEICHELIVVEAAAKSGALLTARMVKKLGKKIWAVPGPITSSVSIGTNKLIAENFALPWLESSFQTSLPASSHPTLTLLQNEGLDSDEISRSLHLPVAKTASELSLLLLSGQIEQRQGKFYARQS